uniref:No mechanoreceptor potential A n=1 Tax=Phlebotomus papatasi TaxID=29031 RepID=A0A1B0DI86_PHLPP
MGLYLLVLSSFNDIDRSGSPIPIEYLPAENTMNNKVRLLILYQGRPTTTIAVGDPLTFRLESQDGYKQAGDIFATNVIARDPYSGRSVQLIDRHGCPVNPYVFPELDKLRDGDTLEARFNAFKIPESNFLVFEATVRSCRDGCQPAYCPGPSGRSEPSFGRKKREINGTLIAQATIQLNETELNETQGDTVEVSSTDDTTIYNTEDEDIASDFPEQVREMIEVFESREEMEQDSYARKIVAPQETICITPSEYHGLISAVILLMVLLLSISLIAGLAYRRYWHVVTKNRLADRHSPVTSFSPSAIHQNLNISNVNSQFDASGRNNSNRSGSTGRPGLSLFSGNLQKTFATGNLSRMCQIPVMNPIRNNGGNPLEFEDPSEPIYTDPSLFERSSDYFAMTVPTLSHCQRECVDSRDFACRSFNYREGAYSVDRDQEASNCELSDRDTRDMDLQDPMMFDIGAYDYYERSSARNGLDGDCLDAVRKDIQNYGDTMTNIVVVQFSDNVQTGRDKREESTCYLTREQAAPEGIGNLMLVPNSVHFTEVCLTSSRPERECPSRRYVFERHPRKKLKLPVSDIKEMTAANRSDCEDKCLNEFSFVCRSANFDSAMRSCSLSRFTRRTHPELMEDDPNSDYLENTCLNAERRCDGLAIFVKEENKKLGGPFEVDIYNNMTLEECQMMCLRAEKYFCRSVEFDDQTKQCILSEEDSVSQKDDISISSSPTHHFYDLVCLDNQRGSEYPDNSVTSHLFSGGRRPDTAFQRYRNSRLGGEFHSEITGRSLSECLDECLRQTSFQCRSAVYSDRFRTCRLSRYNQKDGMRIIYDADYDYYENLMLGGDGMDDRDRPAMRPDMGNDWRNPYPGDRYPPDRYPPSGYPDDGRYPQGDDRYRPGMGDRYYPPPGMGDRYPPSNMGDRYPPSNMGDRYPPSNMGDRYPPGMGDRYPPSSMGDRYPPSGMSDRYPPVMDRYPPVYDNRLPGDMYPNDGRYPMDNRYPTRYPPVDNRYPMMDSRYPPMKGRYPDVPEYWPPPRGRPGMPSGYPGPTGPNISQYPDKTVPPAGRYPESDMRYPGQYPSGPSGFSDTRYPAPGNRYPPVSDNRFPVGYDRFPGYPEHDQSYDRGYPSGGGYYYGYRDTGYGGYDRDRGYNRPIPLSPGYPPYEAPLPVRPLGGSGYDNNINSLTGDGFGGYGPVRPFGSRCDEDNFKQVASRHRMRRPYIRRGQ